MPIYRTDLYVRLTVTDFDLTNSSKLLFQFLQKVSDLRNVQMTKVKLDREEQGKIKIEEWYEMTGSFNVPEGGNSFWVLSKERSEAEPYNFFMRIDRNIKATDYENAQRKALDWVSQTLIQPLEAGVSFSEKSINSPDKLSQITKALGELK